MIFKAFDWVRSKIKGKCYHDFHSDERSLRPNTEIVTCSHCNETWRYTRTYAGTFYEKLKDGTH